MNVTRSFYCYYIGASYHIGIRILTVASCSGRFPDIGPNVVLGEDEIKKPYCTVKTSDTKVSYDTKTVHK